VTHLRKMMLEELQGRKSLRLRLTWWNVRWFDPIAEASELPNHSPSAQLLRSFGHGWAAFLVTDSLVQDQPDESTLSMSDYSDSLIVSQSWDRPAIHDLEDASFGSSGSVSRLIE
jgi:hypothetical protein